MLSPTNVSHKRLTEFVHVIQIAIQAIMLKRKCIFYNIGLIFLTDDNTGICEENGLKTLSGTHFQFAYYSFLYRIE